MRTASQQRRDIECSDRPIRVSAVTIVATGGLVAWLAASGPSAGALAQENRVGAKAPNTPGPSLGSPVPALALSPPSTAIKVTIYHPDSQHVWNRLHRALWVRIGPDGKEYGHDRRDPLLWTETKYLVEGKPHELAIAVLDEFLATHGEKLVNDPLKRAILQRDLWAVFDWTAEPGADPAGAHLRRASSPRRTLQLRLARTIQRLALTPDQIKALPDNYAAASSSRAFAENHDPDHPDRPFLPPDLLQTRGPWVEVEIDNGSTATAPRHVHDFGARSAFRVFLRLPDGREATIAYFDKLRDFPRPWLVAREPDRQQDTLVLNSELPQFPAGTRTALIRQMLLVDTDGRIAATRLTEDVQIRVFRAIPKLMRDRARGRASSGDQDAYEFIRSRAMLFDKECGGLLPLGTDEKDFRTQLQVHRFDQFESPLDRVPFERRMGQTMQSCTACHDGPGIYSVQSYVGGNSRAGRYYLPVLQESDNADRQGEFSTWIKRQQYSWGLLQGLWEEQPSR